MIAGAVDRLPGVPRDLEDHEGDDDTDDRVGDQSTDRASNDAERHKRVDAGVIPVCGQSLTVEAFAATQPHPGGDLIPDEADDAREAERDSPQVMDQVGEQGHAPRADEDDRLGDRSYG